MKNEIWKKPLRSCNIGGEALIEGVMMRGNNKMATAIRKSSGEIVVKTEEYLPLSKKFFLFKIPVIRGAVSMLESMYVGMKVLMNSAEEVDFEEEEEESKIDKFLKKVFGDNFFQFMLYTSLAIALVLGVGIFMLLPNWIASWFTFDKTTSSGRILANFIEGGLRLVIFFSYIYLVSKNKEIKRVFQYHGAEHNAIYTYENMEELTPENAIAHTTLHPRCGTTYLFVAIMTSIILFAFIRWRSPLVNMVLRLALLPLVAGLAYEIFKLAAKTNFKPLRAISYPGLMMQKITTQPPDKEQLEVALAALKAVVEEPEKELEEIAEGEPNEKTGEEPGGKPAVVNTLLADIAAPDTEEPDPEVSNTATPDPEEPDIGVSDTETPDMEAPDTEITGTEAPDTEVPNTAVPDIETATTEGEQFDG